VRSQCKVIKIIVFCNISGLFYQALKTASTKAFMGFGDIL